MIDIVSKDGVREVVGRLRFVPFIGGCQNSNSRDADFFPW